MTSQTYKPQVALLLDVLPEVAKEECFALHGGTAINLFVRDMPRVSVDIDLTYLPIEERTTSLQDIFTALERIRGNIEKTIPHVQVQHDPEQSKLFFTRDQSIVKLEVNLIIRGTLSSPQPMVLCKKARQEFGVFCDIAVVPIGQLYGGKICAALDRQHPRDIFDVRYQLECEGFTHEIKTGFLFCLLSSNRPVHELLWPNLQDQRQAMKKQFEGMTDEQFSYEDYEATRKELIPVIHSALTAADKQFLLSFFAAEPDWSIFNFEPFPSIRWKLQNLHSLRETQPAKYEDQRARLRRVLKE